MSLPKGLFVSNIVNGATVEGVFEIRKIDLLPLKSGAGNYLNLVLADKTGSIEGRVWEQADAVRAALGQVEFAKLVGNATTWKERLQVVITRIAPVDSSDVNPDDFLPVTPKDRDAMAAEIDKAISGLTNRWLRQLLEIFWNPGSDYRPRIVTAPAAKGYHQAYIGGLLEHVTNMLRLVPAVCTNYPEADRDLLAAGVILHDIGKIDEYVYTRRIDFSDEGRLLGHIALGLRMVDKVITEHLIGFPNDLRLRLLHMIASHHGQYEWQSPKRPKFLEACLLHHIDLMDGEAYQFSRAAIENDGEDWVWDKGLGRWVWTKRSEAEEQDGDDRQTLF